MIAIPERDNLMLSGVEDANCRRTCCTRADNYCANHACRDQSGAGAGAVSHAQWLLSYRVEAGSARPWPGMAGRPKECGAAGPLFATTPGR